eukprot:7599284-Pyramimonas_sp.AAC.1
MALGVPARVRTLQGALTDRSGPRGAARHGAQSSGSDCFRPGMSLYRQSLEKKLKIPQTDPKSAKNPQKSSSDYFLLLLHIPPVEGRARLNDRSRCRILYNGG